MNSEETKKVLLQKSIEVLVRENELIRSKVKVLHEKHASNNRKIEQMMEEISCLESKCYSVKKETIWMKILRNLSKLFFGGKFKKVCSAEKLLTEEEEPPSSENSLRGRSCPSLCKPMEVEDAILTVDGETVTKRSGSVQTINDTEELFKEMTPKRKKIKIIVEDGDLDTSTKKVISPSSSFEDDGSPACPRPVVVLPSSSFRKNIGLDLTGHGSSSTPVSGDSYGPAVFLFRGKGDEEEEEMDTELDEKIGKKIPLTLEEQ